MGQVLEVSSESYVSLFRFGRFFCRLGVRQEDRMRTHKERIKGLNAASLLLLPGLMVGCSPERTSVTNGGGLPFGQLFIEDQS